MRRKEPLDPPLGVRGVVPPGVRGVTLPGVRGVVPGVRGVDAMAMPPTPFGLGVRGDVVVLSASTCQMQKPSIRYINGNYGH